MNTRTHVGRALCVLLVGWSVAGQAVLYPAAASGQAASSDSLQAGQPADLQPLPFSKSEIPGPILGVGAGAGIYAVDLGSVERAFGTIEDVYRSQGYSLPSAHLDLDAMRLYRVTVRVGRKYNLVGQVGRSKNQLTELKMTGGLLTRRIAASASGDASLTAGLGGGAYSYSFTRLYGVQVSPTYSDGSFDYLRRVTLEGSGAYWMGAGGFTLRPASHVALDGVVQYARVKDASAPTERAGRVTINLSGVVLGASLTFFY